MFLTKKIHLWLWTLGILTVWLSLMASEGSKVHSKRKINETYSDTKYGPHSFLVLQLTVIKFGTIKHWEFKTCGTTDFSVCEELACYAFSLNTLNFKYSRSRQKMEQTAGYNMQQSWPFVTEPAMLHRPCSHVVCKVTIQLLRHSKSLTDVGAIKTV